MMCGFAPCFSLKVAVSGFRYMPAIFSSKEIMKSSPCMIYKTIISGINVLLLFSKIATRQKIA